MSDEMLTSLQSIHANALRLASQIGDDQWALPTPCSEWDVSQLVNHITGSIHVLSDAAERVSPTMEPNDDHSGDDPVGALKAATEKSQRAWTADGALDGMVTVPGDMPASVCLGITILDSGTHVWDLATAIGANHGLTNADIAVIDSMNRRVVMGDVRAGGGFGQELESASDEALTSMLAFVGRTG
jgi:uncharacterized protein (TIGR03086 family)